MPTRKTLLTSVTSDSRKGRRYVEICRAQYDKAELDGESAQILNEHPGFAAYLAAGIRQFSAKGPVFPVYLDLEVGGKSKDNLIVEFESSGVIVSIWVHDIMSKPAWKPGERETVKFARVTLRELGFTQKPTSAQIWARIKELGHLLCEPGDGPAIRMALKNQPRGDVFWTAMKPIIGSSGRPSVFCNGCRSDGQLWFDASWVLPDREWNLGDGVVFRIR